MKCVKELLNVEDFTHTKSLGPTLVTDASDMLLIGSVS